MGSCTSSEEKGEDEKTTGCCPCFFKSSCRAKALNIDIEFNIEGEIPEVIPVTLKRGKTTISAAAVKVGDRIHRIFHPL